MQPEIYPVSARGSERTKKPTRVFVADEHPIIAAALRCLCGKEADLAYTGSATTLAALRKSLDDLKPDVLVVDLCLGEEDVLSALPELRKRHRRMKIVVFSRYDAGLFAGRSMRAGASAYVSKSDPTCMVAEAVRSVRDGNIYFPVSSPDPYRLVTQGEEWTMLPFEPGSPSAPSPFLATLT